MSRVTLINTPEDMRWLADVHCPNAAAYPLAILHGNEDSPDRIELYLEDAYQTTPVVLVYDPATCGYIPNTPDGAWPCL